MARLRFFLLLGDLVCAEHLLQHPRPSSRQAMPIQLHATSLEAGTCNNKDAIGGTRETTHKLQNSSKPQDKPHNTLLNPQQNSTTPLATWVNILFCRAWRFGRVQFGGYIMGFGKVHSAWDAHGCNRTPQNPSSQQKLIVTLVYFRSCMGK